MTKEQLAAAAARFRVPARTHRPGSLTTFARAANNTRRKEVNMERNTSTNRPRKPCRKVIELDRLEADLSERDRKILQIIDLLKVMSGSQLRRLCFAGTNTARTGDQLARRALLRLTQARLLHRLERRVGGAARGSEGFVYCLAPDGQRLLRRGRGEPEGRGRLWSEPGLRTLDHRLAVTEFYVSLTETTRERQHSAVLEFAVEPACWRDYLGNSLSQRTLKPDAFARIGVADLELVWWLEIDRGTVTQRTRASQAEQYREYWRSGAAGDLMPRVLWVAKTEAQADRVGAAIDPAAAPPGLFVVATDSTAASVAVETP
jgi:protein involved in plasmid replication-relaxation